MAWLLGNEGPGIYRLPRLEPHEDRRMDLFGNATAEHFENADLFEGRKGLLIELAERREKAARAEMSARLRPDDSVLQQRAARALAEYLKLRDYCRRMSAEEIANFRRAEGQAEQLPDDNEELFG